MKKTVTLDFDTNSGMFQMQFDLCDNAVAQRWYDKLSYLQDQGIVIDTDSCSQSFGPLQDYKVYHAQLDQVIDWVNTSTTYCIEKRSHYGQPELCAMHDVYVDMANDPDYDIFPQTYQLNQLIHLCENALAGRHDPLFYTISWGGNDGDTMEDFSEDPYQYYTLDIRPGSLYLYWVEIGKRPGEYWHDQDPDDMDSFMHTVRPHLSWSAHCKINLRGRHYRPPAFWAWFDSYRERFLQQYGLSDYTDLHECGAIALAHPRDPGYLDQLRQCSARVISIRV
jgi:hypothetical protein